MQFLFHSSLLVFIVSSVLAGQVACRPFPASEGENNRNQVLDTSRKLFGMGTVECCSITLMPTTLKNGSAGVQVVQSCTVIMADECPPSTQSAPIANPTSSSSTTVSTSVTVGTTFPLPSGATSMPESTATTSSSSPTSSSTSDTSTSTTQLSFFPPSSTATTSTPTSTISSTSTTSSSTPSQTSLDSSAITTTKQSSALPKIIGAFAGVAMLLLIVAGIFGYKRQKRLQEKVDGNKISWPTFR